ncbi:MAG: salicylate synthase [Pseudonocardia sp.]
MPQPVAQLLDGVRYAEATVPLGLDPVTAAAGLARATREPFVLYERPGEVSVGFGAAAEIVLTGSEIRFRGLGGRADRWSGVRTSDQPMRQVGELLAECGIDGWRAYGWLAFELSYLPDVPDGTILGHVVVPAREVRLRAGSALLRARRWDDLAELHGQLERSPTVATEPVGDMVTDDTVGRDEYLRAVAGAIDDIRDGRLAKVVLSRVVPVPARVDLAGSYLAGRRGNTPARSFLLRLGELGAAGFSPETVLEVGADGTVSTQPLAGTRALTGVPSRDAALRQELLTDPKEVFEHAVSVRGAQDELRAVCVDDSVQVGEFMAVARRGSVQHLASRVTGKLAESCSGWQALDRAFPAVTVSGLPKPSAYRAIRRYEGEPRGLYGGVVVAADADGSLDAAVALRTIFQRDGRTWLRAGAGIVADSVPEREFEETREKLRSIARFLVPDPVRPAAGQIPA